MKAMVDGKAILCIGDMIYDRWIFGSLTGISREAPVPVLQIAGYGGNPGGAGNLAANLSNLYDPEHCRCAPRVFVLGAVGDDASGNTLISWLQARGCVVRLVRVSGATAEKTRIVCEGQQLFCMSAGGIGPSEDALLQVLAEIWRDPSNIGAVVIGDYGRGALSPDLLRWLQGQCAAAHIPLFADVCASQLQYYTQATLVKCNIPDAMMFLADDVHPALAHPDIRERGLAAALQIRARLSPHVAVVTCGSEGCAAATASAVDHVPANVCQVGDPTGAGDTFMAALVTDILENPSAAIEDSCRRANIAAELAVRHTGVHVPTRDAWDEAILAAAGWAGKCIMLQAVPSLIARARRQGKRIVFTNGCFDLLHQGHLRLLQEASACGDMLLVAVNTDASVRMLKGETRPVVDEQTRLQDVAQFAPVTAAFLFDGDVEPLVRTIRPDILVKGVDWRQRQLPGADFVAKHGGEVRFVDAKEFYSTTAIANTGD
jgi:D-beta-D-heptose 7-phosphate kinase/D-beta-D-heptose 1-phosphate adenosyltransferase